ncbi:MAG: hypothetical protein DGJ47_000814 [Rickettsiaceae bacterium]
MKITYSIASQNHSFYNLKEIKNYLRISHKHDDELLKNLLKSAIDYAEQILSNKISEHEVLAEIKLTTKNIKLKYGKINHISSVTLFDELGSRDISNDFGSLNNHRNQLILNNQYIEKNLRIKYMVGYTPGNIPQNIRHGLLTHVAKMYEQSEHVGLVNDQIKSIYTPHRTIKI